MSRPFLFRAGLEGMAPEDSLHVLLSPEWARGSALVFLDRAFPEDEEGREKVRSLFDIEDNPDLPEIYGVFLAVTEEWRDGRCLLHLYAGDGEEVEINSPISALIRPDADAAAPPVLQLRLQQRYRAVEYAARSRFWPGKDGLLDWLRTTTLLYFLDKHEAILPASPESDEDLALAPVTARLQEQGLVGESADGATIAITEEGRDAIGALLSETESRIDQYDHFKDAALDPALDAVEFGSGRGIDLRVQAFLAQGLDPARTVFLLRLYDGSLDESLPLWKSAIHKEDFYDRILEPVVNRHHIDQELMEWVIDHGQAWLEEREEAAQAAEARRALRRRLRR